MLLGSLLATRTQMPGIITGFFRSAAVVVIIDEKFLRSPRAMWELGVMMAARRSSKQPQPPTRAPRPAVWTVLPVVLMDPEAVTAMYEQQWTPKLTERARSVGYPPATLADLRCLLGYRGIRRDQARRADRVLDMMALPLSLQLSAWSDRHGFLLLHILPRCGLEGC